VVLYLIAIFTYIDPSDSLPSSPDQKKWRELMSQVWNEGSSFPGHTDFFLDALPTLVMMTRQNFRRDNDVATDNFRALTQQRAQEFLAMHTKEEVCSD
jgi:hypothetical protein